MWVKIFGLLQHNYLRAVWCTHLVVGQAAQSGRCTCHEAERWSVRSNTPSATLAGLFLCECWSNPEVRNNWTIIWQKDAEAVMNGHVEFYASLNVLANLGLPPRRCFELPRQRYCSWLTLMATVSCMLVCFVHNRKMLFWGWC